MHPLPWLPFRYNTATPPAVIYRNSIWIIPAAVIMALTLSACNLLRQHSPDCFDVPSLSTASVVGTFERLPPSGDGAIVGKVIDHEAGEGISQVQIQLRRVGSPSDVSSSSFGAAAGAGGYYLIDPLPPGIYRMIGRYIGYDEVALDTVEVVANQVTVVELHMGPCYVIMAEPN